MADDANIDPGTSPTMPVAADDIGGVKYQRVKIRVGVDGNAGTDVSTTDPLPVSDAGGSLTVDGTVTVTGVATAANQTTEQGLVGSLTETAPATDTASSGLNGRLQRIAQRLTSILAKQPALGTAGSASTDVITVQGIASGTVIPVADGGGSLTVDGTVTANLAAGTNNIGDVDVLSLPSIPAGANVIGALTANQSVNQAQVGGTATDTNSGNKSAGTQRVVLATDQPALTNALKVDGSAVTQPVSGTVTANIGTVGTLATAANQTAEATLIGAVNETAPATDTASSGLNGRLQRIAQRLTTLLAGGLPAALGANGGLKIEGVASGTVVPVGDGGGSLTVDGTVGVSGTVAVTDNAGSLTVDAPVGTPAFVRLSDGAAAITTLPVSLASVPSHAVTNAGTFAVQAAATIADGADVAQGTTSDASSANTVIGLLKNLKAALAGTLTVGLPSGASTSAKQPALGTAGSPSSDVLTVQGSGSGTALPVSLASVPSHAVTNAGTFAVQPTQPSAATGAPSAFTATTSTTIFSSNASAKMRTFANDSDKILYVMLRAAAVTTSSYHIALQPGDFYSTDYTGEVRGILSASIGTGQVLVGEFT